MPTLSHDAITLELLTLIDNHKVISQRALAGRVGIALGATNGHVKRCLANKLIESCSETRRGYVLTTRGKKAKETLTRDILTQSLRAYDEAKDACMIALGEAKRQRFKRVYVYGTGHLAEIAAVAQLEEGTSQIHAFFDPSAKKDTFLGRPVVKDVHMLKKTDGVVFTCLENPVEALETLRDHLSDDHILIPGILKHTLY